MLREAMVSGDRSPTTAFAFNGNGAAAPASAAADASAAAAPNYASSATALDDFFGDDGAPATTSAQQHRLEDVFGSSSEADDNDDDDNDAARQQDAGNDGTRPRQAVSDIPRLRSVHVTAGYRDGIAASKGAHVQTGFDEGFPLGAVLGLKAGWILGVLEGVTVALRGVGGARFEGARQRVVDARRELDVGVLCGEEYFDKEGVWRFDVGAGEEGEGEVTFETVAACHPLLVRWGGIVATVAVEEGVDLGILDRRPAVRGDEEEGAGVGEGEAEEEVAAVVVG